MWLLKILFKGGSLCLHCPPDFIAVSVRDKAAQNIDFEARGSLGIIKVLCNHVRSTMLASSKCYVGIGFRAWNM